MEMITDAYYGGNFQNIRDGDHTEREVMGPIRPNMECIRESCKALDLSPSYIPNPKIIQGKKFLELQQKYAFLIEFAISYVGKIELLIPTGNAVIDICTETGIIVQRLGSAPALEKIGYVLGCVVGRDEFGNTALDIALKQDSPTMVYGKEHFLDILKGWTDFCVPIHGTEGHILGAINIVVPVDYANKNILNLIIMAARGIENDILFLEEKNKLAATNEVLYEFNQGVMEMASIVSHDICNSLSTISAYVQLLQLQGILDKQKVDKILSEIRRINKLLYNFKLLAEPLKFNLYRHSLKDILNSTVYTFNAKANMAGITITLELLEKDVFVIIDRDLMERVFINIIMNAIQAMEEEGGVLNIRCSLGEAGDKVNIIFEDTGPGIEEESLENIFKLFYTTKEGGSGLGLAICQHIVRVHGGDILVESIKGEGAKFIIVLPCIKACAAE